MTKLTKVGKNIVMSMLDTVMSLSIGTPKTFNFPFVPNVKLIILGVPKFGHTTAYYNVLKCWDT